MVKELTSLTNSPFRIRILKRGPAWPGHEPARTQRLILPIIKIDLPSAESAARIDNFPSCAAKNLPHRRIRRLDDHAVAQAARSAACGGGEPRHERSNSAPDRMFGEGIGDSAVVSNVI